VDATGVGAGLATGGAGLAAFVSAGFSGERGSEDLGVTGSEEVGDTGSEDLGVTGSEDLGVTGSFSRSFSSLTAGSEARGSSPSTSSSTTSSFSWVKTLYRPRSLNNLTKQFLQYTHP